MKRGKKYQNAAQKIEAGKFYMLEEAAQMVIDTSVTKFDASVEIHMKLGVDPKQAEEQIRSTVSLPHGTGKTVRVIAFVSDDKVKDAKAAGAMEAGNTDLIEKIEKGWLDFDTAVATPDMMKDLAKIARVLGQAGLMPNPKSGTVTAKPAEAVKEAKAGKVEFRVDKQSIVHIAVGKASFKPEQLAENAKTVLKAIADAKPASVKGTYVQKVTMTTTMGPSVKIALSEI